MSIRTASEQMAGPIGKELASSDDHAQAAFFNGFFEMVRDVSGGDVATQYCYIADKLTPKARAGIKHLAEFCALKDEVK